MGNAITIKSDVTNSRYMNVINDPILGTHTITSVNAASKQITYISATQPETGYNTGVSYSTNSIYPTGGISTITIGDIVDTILKVTGKTPDVQWDNSKPTTIPFRACSTERIEKELGFKPNYTFEQGIRETIEWYENL